MFVHQSWSSLVVSGCLPLPGFGREAIGQAGVSGRDLTEAFIVSQL